MKAAIRELPFRHNLKPGLACEIFRLAELYDRAERKLLDHRLDVPQRPEFHTIYLGLRGRGELIVDFTAVPLGAGLLTVAARGRVQQFVPDRGVDAWMLLVSPELLDPQRDDPLRTPSILSPAWTSPVLELARSDRRELLAIAGQIAVEHARPLDAVQPALLAALVRALLLRAERLARRNPRPVPPAAIEAFLAVLERDHPTTRSVAHYARAAGVSARHLGEQLVAFAGKPTKQVIDERVILELKRLLAHTDLSVKELAARTGFPEPTNLVKFFRLHAGVTPLAFRARVRTFLPSGRRS